MSDVKTQGKVIDLMEALKASLATPEPKFIPCPEPGVYPDVPADIYHRWDCASNSQLSQLRRSPAHLRAYLDRGREDTDAFRIGRAFHASVLEPDVFAEKYAYASEGCDRRTKAGKDEWAGLIAQYGEGNVLKIDEYRMIVSMTERVYGHPRASKLFNGEGKNELSLVWDQTWDDEKDGVRYSVRCKARIDRYHPTLTKGGVVGDLKSTRDASRHAFERSAYDTGIYRQGAMYLAGANANGLPAEHFAVAAAEKEDPYCVAVYVLTSGTVDAGEEEMKALLKVYQRCKETGRWPGYSENFEPLALPHYGWGDVSERTEGAA